MALPLEGVKVLDLSTVMAGPYCSMVLGDMGADVVKIENFPEGDASRRFDPKVNGESYCFAMLNRNKKSVGLNMKEPRGKEIFLTLAAKAHAFIRGRGYVTPEDVKSIAFDVLRHRIILTYEAEAEDVTTEQIIQRVLDTIEVP